MTTPSTLDELVEEQHAALILLQAMYPRESELNLGSIGEAFLESPSTSYPFINVQLTLTPSKSSGNATQLIFITLEILFAISTDPPKVLINLGPSILSRINHESIRSILRPINSNEGSSEYLFEMIRSVEDQITLIQGEESSARNQDSGGDIGIEEKKEKLERVWFWFPSLSSKEKRKDLVTFGHDAGLTGFVLAGKPGLLCVEGDGGVVDAYMGRIKSESWSDIPSYQKKVTERLRNPLSSPSARLLPRMIDITDQISHYGQYAHRPEMGEVKKQMEKWGVEEEWGQVIMGPGSGGG